MVGRLKMVALAFVAGITGGVLVAVVDRARWHPQLGDLATWATALVALPAVAFGVAAFRQQRADVERLQERQDARDTLLKRQLDREERLTAGSVQVQVQPMTLAHSQVRQLLVTVLNDSDRPVYDVDCRFLLLHSTEAEEVREMHLSPAPWGTQRVRGKALTAPVRVVAPGRTIMFVRQIDADSSQDDAEIEVRFSDDFLRWARFRDGLLTRIMTPDW